MNSKIPLHVLALGIAIGQKSDVEIKPSDLGDFSEFLSKINSKDYVGASDFVRSTFHIPYDEQKLAVSIINEIRQIQKENEWSRLRSKLQFTSSPEEALEMIKAASGVGESQP